METMQTRPARARRGPASVRARAETSPDAAREDYDLLTALVMGAAIGAVATFLLRRGPAGVRPAGIAARAAGTGAMTAGRYAGRYGAKGARWAAERGGELLDELPDADDVLEQVGDYLRTAREAINDTVTHELKDLRRAIRRQRKRVGI
jgi:hypothetical protein